MSDGAVWMEPAFAGRIGVARRDVTPPPDIRARSWGAAATDHASGIHRPLAVTALVLRPAEDDDAARVLVTLDLGWWERAEEERDLRDAVARATGAGADDVVIHLSHTHAGPSASRAAADPVVDAYVDRLVASAADAASEARASARPATLTVATARCGLAANRQAVVDGRPLVGFNPDLPADTTLLVGRVTDSSGGLVAILANYACHPTTLGFSNSLVSPDYVGAARETVEQATGAPLLFLQGASGDLAPRHQYVGDPAIADRHGRQLGYAVLSALAGMLTPDRMLAYAGTVESGAPLAIWEEAPRAADGSLVSRGGSVTLQLKPAPSDEALDASWQELEDDVRAERIRRARRAAQLFGEGSTFEYPFWVWRLGSCVVVAHPGEAFSAFQIELRRRWPGHAVFVLNVANGPGGGYLPPIEEYEANSYAVWQTHYEPGSLERLLEAVDSTIALLVRDGAAESGRAA